MPDKKLTDKETVNALKCHLGLDTQMCTNCAYLKYGSSCVENLFSDLFNLITHLQAGCENYKQVAEHQQSVTMDRGFEIKKALECCIEASGVNCGKCPYCDNCVTDENTSLMMTDALDLINCLQAENENLTKVAENQQKLSQDRYFEIKELKAEVEGLSKENIALNRCAIPSSGSILKVGNALLFAENEQDFATTINTIKAEAYKEFADKISEIFLRYAFLHSHADCARKDYIEADDGTKIEMQSVWDVFTLKEYGIAEYEEMNRLQTNIELIEKVRLLSELEKDFRLLVKELVGEDDESI